MNYPTPAPSIGHLDFAPRCEWHHVLLNINIPATHTFRCTACVRLELRCIQCATFFAANPFINVECHGCRTIAHSFKLVDIRPLGADA